MTSPHPAIEAFKALYSDLRAADIPALMPGVYHPEVEFQDPFHRIVGRDCLEEYLAGGVKDAVMCTFTFHREIVAGNQAFVEWTMQLAHRKLQGGRAHSTPGGSMLVVGEGGIIVHRDYFDAGSMLYERVPVLGSLVRLVKKRV